MSLPIAATGPLKVEMKPILMVFGGAIMPCAAACSTAAEPAASASAAPPKSHGLIVARMLSSLGKCRGGICRKAAGFAQAAGLTQRAPSPRERGEGWGEGAQPLD